jgi:hypothetical protein
MHIYRINALCRLHCCIIGLIIQGTCMGQMMNERFEVTIDTIYRKPGVLLLH